MRNNPWLQHQAVAADADGDRVVVVVRPALHDDLKRNYFWLASSSFSHQLKRIEIR